MLAKEVMSKEFAVCTEDMPLVEVYKLMTDTNADIVTVVENRAHYKPIGIVSEHTICRQVLGKGKNPRGMNAAGVMEGNLVKADKDSDLQYCLQMIGNRLINQVHIVDASGNLCGILSKAVLEEYTAEVRAAEVDCNAFTGKYGNAATNRIF